VRSGVVVIADLFFTSEVLEVLEVADVELLSPEQHLVLLEQRGADSPQGDFVRVVVVVAGSRGKTGAAHLAAMAALRSGAGLVTVATPACCQAIVASMAPELMTEALADVADGTLSPAAVDRVLELAHDVLACGPGLGRTAAVGEFVRGLLDRASVPLVLDADAISVLADDPDRLMGNDEREIIITPHPGEMARLLGVPTEEVQANRLQVATNFATTHRIYVVLKGHRTIIATPEGRAFINPTGNPGMATGGTGDVLTGMIAAWLAQLLDAEAACRLAVFLHGAAGDMAEAERGQAGMTATDLLAHVPDALKALQKDS
jgi:NAD(P)H-hydrate epimerase